MKNVAKCIAKLLRRRKFLETFVTIYLAAESRLAEHETYTMWLNFLELNTWETQIAVRTMHSKLCYFWRETISFRTR